MFIMKYSAAALCGCVNLEGQPLCHIRPLAMEMESVSGNAYLLKPPDAAVKPGRFDWKAL